ncbi:hypothetical protein B0H66DRAFT_572421 [Apodospora peruviana]|uniref:HMG box domain-containing protein n=1 Tax=Apodospora peruviana TaxID=516989 RepID=A0AAE0IS63_9PEZI|nr:hypothetical protein B0H66DRAFT_572421 [Apodospora peruviana]
MDRNTPLSPAISRFERLPTGFNELMQHNASRGSYHHDAFPREPNQGHSQPTSRYGSSVPQQHRPQTFDTAMMQYQQRPGSGGQFVRRIPGSPAERTANLNSLPGFRQPMYAQDSSPYGPIQETFQPYSTPATSPPTPSRASDIMTTRSGTVIHRSGGANTLAPRGGRVEKAATKKRKKGEKAKAPKNVPTLAKPLSQIEVEAEISVANIEEYVNRSPEVRRQEVETGKNPGRIKRPMNAFMLYRKAYQLRAKEWASQHNHQVVSRVCGLSWPMEPEHVREQFKTWAEIERENHQKAHPDYKFTPSKPAAKPPKSPTQSRFDHSDGSDLDDLDWNAPRNRSTTKTPADDMESDYYPGRSLYGPPSYPLTGIHGLGISHQGRSAFEYSNPGKLAPSTYDHRDMPGGGQYYEVRNPARHLPHGMIEDVMISRSHSPAHAFHPQHHQPQGLPMPYHGGGPAYHGQQHHPPQPQGVGGGAQSHRIEHHHRIDPSLMPSSMFDGSGGPGGGSSGGGIDSMLLEGEFGGTPRTHQAWQPTTAPDSDDGGQYSSGFLGLDETLSIDQTAMEQQAQLLRGNPGEWQRQELPDTEQFDMSWMDPPPPTKAD